MFKLIIEILLIGIVIRFIFRFLFPVIHITKVTSDRMRQMQKQMDEMQQKTNNQQSHQVKDGDYIDYEEVK